MKLAVTLLTLCCLYVSLSQQQQQYMARRYPLPFYYNSYYDDSSPQLLSRNHLMMGRQQAAPFFVVRNNYIQPYSSPSPPTPSFEDQNLMNQLEDGGSEDDYASITDDSNEQVLARAPFRGLKNSLFLDNNNKADGRLFFNNFFSLLRSITSTKTVLSTVTSTLTTITVKTCASAKQFVGLSSATACRRRRSAVQIAALEQDQHFVAPSQVQPLEVSAAPAQIRIQRELSDSPSSAEIESSQQIRQQEEDNANNNLRSVRQLRSLIVSSTLTITSYSLVPSTVTKSITLGIGGCSTCVLCVPAGVTIC